MRRVQDFVHRTYGTNYRVELFGSTAYGVDSPTSDLDLVIVVRSCFHPRSPGLPNLDQDTQRMDGFPPSLNLAGLPRTHILPSIDLPRTQPRAVRKPSTMSGLSHLGLCVPQRLKRSSQGRRSSIVEGRLHGYPPGPRCNCTDRLASFYSPDSLRR